MPRCSRCGFVLPEGCPSCPPYVINCPGCCAEVLIEPSQDQAVIEMWKRIKKGERP